MDLICNWWFMHCIWTVLKLVLKKAEECDWKEIPRLPLTNPSANRSDRRLRRGNGLGWEPDGQLLIARWAMAQRVLGVNPKVLYIRRWNQSLSLSYIKMVSVILISNTKYSSCFLNPNCDGPNSWDIPIENSLSPSLLTAAIEGPTTSINVIIWLDCPQY